MAIKPLEPRHNPKAAEAEAKGGHHPAPKPEAGKQPLSEPYGKASKDPEEPANPAHRRG